ncbi:response regulator [Flavobacteriales bacterium]|nr:response regulator [Flavobacteriales bacterium]
MEKILVVEDEQGIRDTLQEILELAGYTVLTASDGKIGYDVIVENQPDLVLCDVNMPELGGFELLEAVNQRFKDEIIPPFLFLTAKVEVESLRYGMSLGADDYIFKPFASSDILKTVRLRLDRRNQLLDQRPASKPETVIADANKLALPCNDGLELISFDKIIKCQADRAYCNFYLADKRKILVSKPMKDFEEVLTSKNFLKVHKSTIVNIKHIEKFVRGKAGCLLMSDGSSVNVSVRKKEELMHLLIGNT